MPSLRKDPLSSVWHVFAPGRADRPNALSGASSTSPATCPFCPGNEGETPPEVFRTPPTGAWRVRVFPNLFPMVSTEPIEEDVEAASERSAIGHHEVIVETPRHGMTFDDLEPTHAVEVVDAWIGRWATYAGVDERRSVILFHNQGNAAGESIPHSHSQLVTLPWVPPRMTAERQRSRDASCALCHATTSSGRSPHFIARTGAFLTVAPFSSRFPYQIWIVPSFHAPSFREIEAAEREDLAAALRTALKALRSVLGPVAVNWSFQQSESPDDTRFHWYLEIVPRLTMIAGFELATGAFINIIDPAAAGAALRHAIDPPSKDTSEP